MLFWLAYVSMAASAARVGTNEGEGDEGRAASSARPPSTRQRSTPRRSERPTRSVTRQQLVVEIDVGKVVVIHVGGGDLLA